MSVWTEKELKEINDRAYYKWIDAGRPDNMSQVFWDQAEKEFEENHVIEVNLPFKRPRVRPSFTFQQDVGYVYTPYISLSKTPVIKYTPPKKGSKLKTKYSKKLLQEASKFYSKKSGN